MLRKGRQAHGNLVNPKRQYSEATNAFALAQHIDPKLSDAIEKALGISKPTEMQTTLFDLMLNKRSNILIRQTTGTGKTMGLLLALLSYSQQRTSLTQLFVVPNRELALQIEDWSDALLKLAYPNQSRYRILQRFVSGSPYETEQKRVLKRHGLPKIILGTPRCLLEMTQMFENKVDLLVVDEVDQVIKLPGKYASSKQVLLRKEKPALGQVLVERILGVDTFEINQREMQSEAMEQVRRKKERLVRSKERKQAKAQKVEEVKETEAEEKEEQKQVSVTGTKRRDVQLVVSSATANHRLRNLISARSWVSHPPVVLRDSDLIKIPAITQHYCLVIDNEESIRNIKQQTSLGEENVHQSTYARHLEQKALSNKENPWVADIMSRTIKQQQSVMQLMAEVASNVINYMQPLGTVILFIRSDANSRQFTNVLRSYGIDARDIMDRYERVDCGSQSKSVVYLATEEAARGVDIPDTELVLILDVPKNIASYVHLSGRTGRFGRPGAVFTVVPVGKYGWYESKMQGVFSSLQITVQNAPFVE
ncbi:hypothetical protein GGF40_001057 [Coemansia sp. RSA 1286]|nr:hypothetical protein GGF40_001057 [Coemansia sp. RSA 1286]